MHENIYYNTQRILMGYKIACGKGKCWRFNKKKFNIDIGNILKYYLIHTHNTKSLFLKLI